MNKEERKRMVSKDEKLSVRQQCVLLGLCRTSLYYTASEETAENLEIMQLLDRQYAVTPFYGQRRLQAWLAAQCLWHLTFYGFTPEEQKANAERDMAEIDRQMEAGELKSIDDFDN